MEKILWLLFVIQQLYTTESFRSRAASKSSPLQKFPPILTKKQTSQPTSSLFLTSSDDDLLNENYEEESFQPPLEQFFTVLQDSIVGETLLKLSLSENGFSSDDEEAQNDEENDINWEDVKGWTAISGRLIKTKGESKLQLISYKDKSMKKSDQSKNYTSSEEALKVIRAYIEKAYKKITLSTKESDFELKMRKGGGKFRATSKVISAFFYIPILPSI
jgi:hypothetical protein